MPSTASIHPTCRRGSRRLAFVGVTLAALGLLASACGSSSGAAPSPPSKATYDSQANAICKSYSSKLSSLGSSLQSSSSASQVEQVLNQAITVAQQGTSKLEALPRPSGESSSLAAAYQVQEQQVTELKNLLAAVQADNPTEIKSDEAGFEATETSVNQKFDALGLTTCGSGSSSGSS
jgi:hypothetical protein